MIIAIDYDGTYSRFPDQFNLLRKSFQSIGAEVYIVTARCEELTPIEEDLSAFDGILYTCNKAKAACIDADIFVDDNPITLCTNMNFTNGAKAFPSSNLHQTWDGKQHFWHWNKDLCCFTSENRI